MCLAVAARCITEELPHFLIFIYCVPKHIRHRCNGSEVYYGTLSVLSCLWWTCISYPQPTHTNILACHLYTCTCTCFGHVVVTPSLTLHHSAYLCLFMKVPLGVIPRNEIERAEMIEIMKVLQQYVHMSR